MLADAGADVIKIEPPEGDPLRRWSASHTEISPSESGAFFKYLNASKRGAIADLEQPAGRKLLLDLAASADLIIASCGASRLRSLDLGWEVLHARNPALSLVSISPWGQTGPWAERPMLNHRTIVIAGVGPGLGEETVRISLREGANVVLGARDEKRLVSIAKGLDPKGDRLVFTACDVESEDGPESLVQLAIDRFGRVDGLVCVAARIDVVGTIESTPIQGWRDVFGTNVIGTMRMIQAAIPAMKANDGSIVLVGSQSEVHPDPAPGFIAYGASKQAMHSATLYMADQLGPFDIRVNRVFPSTMWTPTHSARSSR
jgi:NAD(P)-dependent dehydrogenase (short-subunit alcohol dehydrogenase family)